MIKLWQAVLPLPPRSSKVVHSLLASCKLPKRFWSPTRSPRFAANSQVGSRKRYAEDDRYVCSLDASQAHFRRSAWAGKDQQLLHCAKHSRHLPGLRDRDNCTDAAVRKLQWDTQMVSDSKGKRSGHSIVKEKCRLLNGCWLINWCQSEYHPRNLLSNSQTRSAFYRFLNSLEVTNVPRNVLDRLHQFAWDLANSSELRIVIPSLDILPSYQFLQNSSKL